MMDLIGKFLVGVVVMTNVQQYDLFGHYGKLGFSERQIQDDLIFTLQNRLMNMSNLQKDEYGINEEFFNNTNLFDMYDAGRIRATYDEKSTEPYPTYNLEIDFDGDGIFSTVPNPKNTEVNFRPMQSVDFSDGKFSRDSFFQTYFKEQYESMKSSMPSDVRDFLVANPWADGFLESTITGYSRFAEFDREFTEKFANFIDDFSNQEDRVGAPSVFKKIVRTVFENTIGFDANKDRLEFEVQEAQRDYIKQAMYGQVNANNFINNPYLAHIYKNEGAFSESVYDPMNKDRSYEYLSQMKNGKYINDPTIGYGLSLNDKWVTTQLINKGYNIESLLKGEQKLELNHGMEISVNYMNIKKNDLVDFFGEDLAKPENSYLMMALLDLNYLSGFNVDGSFIGDRMKSAIKGALTAKTTEEKLGYLGDFSSYIPSDLLEENKKAYIGYDNDRQTYAMYPEATIAQELFNDGARYGQYKGRFMSNFQLLEMWAEGRSTNSPVPEFELELPSLNQDDNMPVEIIE
jgi:hypothetical protein